MQSVLLNKREYQKQYRTSGFVLFLMSVLVLCMRISANLLSRSLSQSDVSDYVADITLDLFFSGIVQLGILFLMPLIVYKLVLKMSFRQVFSFSNFRKTKPINIVLAVAIGITGIFVTIGISMIWQVVLILFGYMPPSSSTAYFPSFNIGIFLLSIFLTGVLPGFCEEFTMRGGFLTSIRSSFPLKTVILVSALAFGLFHQYVLQTFYTACFGALMAFLTIRTKSIYPAMIVHFVNNGLSVYLDFAAQYGMWGGGLFEGITTMLLSAQFFMVILLYAAFVMLMVMLIKLVARINPKEVPLPVMLDGSTQGCFASKQAFASLTIDSATVKRAPKLELEPKILPRFLPHQPAPPLENDADRILFVNNRYYLLKGNYLFALRPKAPFSPKLEDNIFYIGAIVVSALTTIFTLIFGFIV